MIFDSHAHLKHGDEAATEYSAAEIVRAMDAAGIGRSVVFAMSTTTERSVEIAGAAAAEFPGRLVPYVYALPGFEGSVLAEIEEALARGGFRGIKLHAGECSLAPYVADPVFRLAERLGVPCLVDFCGDAPAAERIAGDFPELTLIVAHIGAYLSRDGALLDRFIAIAERHGNVVLDASGVALSGKIAEAVERAGPERVVWGTDGPHAAPDIESFARGELEKVRTLGLPPEVERVVLGGNIARILGEDS